MRINRSAIILMIAGIAVTGCVRRPKGVLSDDEMASLVADMELAEGYIQTQHMEGDHREMNSRIIFGILDEHGVTQAEFDSTMAWYGRNVDDYYKLDGKVRRKLEARRRELEGKGDIADIPVSDIWPYGRMVTLSEKSGSMVLPFSISAPDMIPGSSVTWRMRIRNGADASLMLGVEYENGVVSYLTRPSSGQQKIEMMLVTDTAKKIRRVFGNLLLRRETDLPLWLDSISLESLPFDSTQYYKINTQRYYDKRLKPKPEPMIPTDSIVAEKVLTRL